jgi:hypothetical protein
MKLKIFGVVVLALVMASPLAIVAPAGADWLTMPAPTGAGTGTPFWDNPSLDTGNKNVGYILTGTNDPISGYVTTDWIDYAAGGKAQYLGTSTGGALNSVSFTTSPPTPQPSFLIVTISANASGNLFGIYDLTAPSFNPLATDAYHTQIFPGGQANGSTNTITVNYSAYGYYFYDTATSKLFLSAPTANLSSADTDSNFAFFRSLDQDGVLYLGMEDLVQPNTGEGRFGDYNDMVVQIQTRDNLVPLPPSALLLGSGLLGLVGVGWRRRKTNV